MPYLSLDEINANPPPIEILFPIGRVVESYDKFNKTKIRMQIFGYTNKNEVILMGVDSDAPLSLNQSRKKKTLKNMLKNTVLLQEPYYNKNPPTPYLASRLILNEWLIYEP